MTAAARALAALALAAVLAPAGAAESRPGVRPCRLPGLETEALCGQVRRALDPARPEGTAIDVHFAVLPALARQRKPDAVMFFAGGPGQSALALAGPVSRLLSRLGNRRDIVLVDQRGTGRSAALPCPEPPSAAPMGELLDPARQRERWRQCRAQLQALPHGDLRHYTTVLAVQDAEAVRQALGVARLDLVGGSYGTRVALDYLRQFPQSVRRVVIDGVAPPDMVMPAAFSADNQAALDAVFTACETDAACRGAHPGLRERWRALLAALPRRVEITHPLTGEAQAVELDREAALGLLRAPLYAPQLAAGLPAAIENALGGQWAALAALSSGVAGSRALRLAEGMHFSVVCAEDAPRLGGQVEGAGVDFGNVFADTYRAVCAEWPRGDVPPAFYRVPPAAAPTLVLSGGADPVTPPRHGERVARALGARARHVVVPQAGHGVMALPCLRDVLFRFIDAEDDAAALRVDADCARDIPRPPAFRLPSAASAP